MLRKPRQTRNVQFATTMHSQEGGRGEEGGESTVCGVNNILIYLMISPTAFVRNIACRRRRRESRRNEPRHRWGNLYPRNERRSDRAGYVGIHPSRRLWVRSHRPSCFAHPLVSSVITRRPEDTRYFLSLSLSRHPSHDRSRAVLLHSVLIPSHDTRTNR